MMIMYGIGLVLALLIGCMIGLLATAAHYERMRAGHGEYEQEIAEGRDFYAALSVSRHNTPVNPADDEAKGIRPRFPW